MICTSANRSNFIEADIAVVGAGPSGLALALSLAREGIKVAVIESGLERRDAYAQALSAAASNETPNHPPVEQTTERRLGGTSWIWGGRCVDYDPVDFEMETVGGVAGWPISHAEASSETVAAAEFMGIGRPHFDDPPSWAPPDGVLMARLERWCAEPRLARRHRNEIRSSRKAKFYTGLTCAGVALEPDGGRVAGLRVKDASGADVAVRARHYVIAAGGIGAARLLLASDDVEPCGVGGRSGWLGRGYMGHLKGAIADIVLTGLDDAQVDYRRDGDWYVRLRIMLTAEVLRAEGLRNISFLPDNPAFADPSHRSGPLSAVALALSFPGLGSLLLDGPIRAILLGRGVRRGDVGGHLRNVIADLPGVAVFLASFVPRRYGRRRAPGAFVANRARRYLLKYSGEHTPLRDSRVTLSGVRDAAGARRIDVRAQVPPQDVESVLRAHQILDAELRQRGLGRLEFHGEAAELLERIRQHAVDGYHQVGLTRMSADPADGVVDRDCRVHGIENLYLAGTGVLPTSGQANPTYLAVCLALRLARKLAADVKV